MTGEMYEPFPTFTQSTRAEAAASGTCAGPVTDPKPLTVCKARERPLRIVLIWSLLPAATNGAGVEELMSEGGGTPAGETMSAGGEKDVLDAPAGDGVCSWAAMRLCCSTGSIVTSDEEGVVGDASSWV
jgi:hypothetical protein